jgi:hypothetical protein
MGRRKIYATVEEAKAAQRAKTEEQRLKKIEAAGRNGVAHPCKHKMMYVDKVRVDIGTLDRTKMDTAYVDMMVATTYTNDEDILDQFRHNSRKAFNTWIDNQDMWDKRHKIMVMEYPALNKSYKGASKSFTLQIHVRRVNPTLEWKPVVESLTNLVEYLIEEIKKTCVETGLELVKRNSHNPSGLQSASS